MRTPTLHISEEIHAFIISWLKGSWRIQIMKQKISIRAVIKRDGKVLVARRYSGRESILGKYELPGGSLDFKEQPRDALGRYVQSQLGVGVETAQLFDVISFIDPDDMRVQYVFVVYQVSLEAGNLKAGGRYDKYLWEKMQNIQHNTLTHSTIVLLGLTESEDLAPVDKGHSINYDAINTTNKAIIYSDGGSRGNPGPSASAYVIMDNNEQIISEGGVYLGITTNNQAEYQAVRLALKRAIEMNLKVVDFRLDSSLVVNQLNGIYKIKNRDLWPIHAGIKEQLKYFDKVSFSHVRREFNQLADALVNKTLDEYTHRGEEVL